MNFNRYIFDCYLATENGRSTVAFFDALPQQIRQRQSDSLFSFLHQRKLVSGGIDEVQELVDFAADYLIDSEYYESGAVTAAENIGQAVENYEIFVDSFFENDNWEEKALLTWLSGLSLCAYVEENNFLFPYFFIDRFFQLEAIFGDYSIPLPPLPTKTKYRERLSYYGELSRVLYDFRLVHGLTSAELCAFLYDFAPNSISDFIQDGNLPEAVNVYISGGTQKDTQEFYTAAEDYQIFWQGNPNTQVGDIILLYSLAPYSAITGIFRAFSTGYYDPFSFYSNRIWVGSPIRIPEIKLSELKDNSVWKEKGLVKANMQGVNGRQCSTQEYEAILNILKQKGFAVGVLPKLISLALPEGSMPMNERDVEIALLEPLLKRLGFCEQDWLRQMPLRMGRGERVYPDYALLAQTRKGEEEAEFIWEAKYRISNKADLKEAFFQAKSYALRLNCQGLGLVALEGVWIVFADNHFSFEKLKYFSWQQLTEPDIFSELAGLCGKPILT